MRHLIHKKYAALRKFRESKTVERKLKLRTATQNVKSLIKRKHREYLAKVEDSLSSNPKHFWSYHKAILHHRTSPSTIITYNGASAKTASEKANLFNQYFSSTFSHPSTDNVNEVTSSYSFPLKTDTLLSNITLCVEEVSDCLNSLDTTKACGPDGIPSRLLKECSQQIAPSLCTIFNYSLICGRFPSEWKSANVTPVHKKNSKEPAENYRPISLLSIVSKVMERCVYNHMYADVIQLISPLQHGFLRKRSCITQLLSVLHNIGQNLDKNTQSDVLYLDFAKAFDSVDHQILVKKLKCYGVAGRLLDWFTDYLNGRTQRVVIDGAVSQWVPVTSGVPQGSILGPLLFVIFINDLPEIIPNGTNTALFADDTKLHRTISSLTDCEGLQQALSNINIWSQQGNMTFNSTKCKVLTITRKQNPVVYDYQLGSAILTRVQQEKDLGVTISSKLTWHHHISVIVAKANKLLGLLKRTCPLLTDIQVRRSLYLSLVKSQLCYATQVWSPAQDMLKAKLERVQRRATKWIFGYKGKEMSYHQRLQLLHLLPLCYDREIKDLTFFYKALYGYIDVNVNKYIAFIGHGRTRHSQIPLVMKAPRCKTNAFQASFYNRIVKLWNTICKSAPVHGFSNISSFKQLLKQTYLTLFNASFDIDFPCTWTLSRDCSCH